MIKHSVRFEIESSPEEYGYRCRIFLHMDTYFQNVKTHRIETITKEFELLSKFGETKTEALINALDEIIFCLETEETVSLKDGEWFIQGVHTYND